MFAIRHGFGPIVLVVPLVSCGERTAGLGECVSVRVLEFSSDQITRSGRTFHDLSDWTIGQIEPDGSYTTVMQLDVDLNVVDYHGTIEHDPESGRMWLLAWSYEDLPGWLFQFDATGQVEWADELNDVGGTVVRGSLLHHDDALVVAMRVQAMGPPSLIVERRDLAGEVVWTSGELPTPDDYGLFATAQLVGVADGAIAMVATPPLIDYGPSYPLTLDFASGIPIWTSQGDGHDPLAMAVDDQRVYLAWTSGPRFDPDQLPEKRVEIERATSSLKAVTPDGEALVQAELEWPKGWREFEDDEIALAWMGDRLISLVGGSSAIGVTVYDQQGELECQGKIDLDIEYLGPAIGLAGREQTVVAVALRTEQAPVPGMLLLEPR
jgi:hypothetical protein